MEQIPQKSQEEMGNQRAPFTVSYQDQAWGGCSQTRSDQVSDDGQLQEDKTVIDVSSEEKTTTDVSSEEKTTTDVSSAYHQDFSEQDVDVVGCQPQQEQEPGPEPDNDGYANMDESSHYDGYSSMDESYQSDDYDGYGHGLVYDSFEKTYLCISMSAVGKPQLERGDQIIIPESALDPLLRTTNFSSPMLFEIRNESKGRVSHCGVSEFTATEGTVNVPAWIMKNLQLQDGEAVTLKSVNLERATFVKLQPHTMDFLDIRNPKVALEQTLSTKFFCLTTGDTIVVNYEGKDFQVNVIETKPSSAVCIIDTDCEVDFAPPLNYKEPEKPAKQMAQNEPSEEAKFKPFSGVGRRLSGKPADSTTSMDVASDARVDAKAKKRTSKSPVNSLVFRSYGSQDKPIKQQRDNSAAEDPQKKYKFQPFTGKKYSLME